MGAPSRRRLLNRHARPLQRVAAQLGYGIARRIQGHRSQRERATIVPGETSPAQLLAPLIAHAARRDQLAGLSLADTRLTLNRHSIRWLKCPMLPDSEFENPREFPVLL
jgi:hypothetical protein